GAWTSPSLIKTASPEMLRGKLADPASDLYSFGALLFEVLSGKPPFTGETGVDVAIAHLTGAAPAPSAAAPRGWVGKELDELVAKLLAKSPNARAKDARAVLE